MTRSNGELVPADADAEAKRRQELENRRALQAHSAALADLKDEEVETRLDRRERRADARERRALTKLNRQAKISGARVRISHELKSSGEIKALRIIKIRKIALAVLLPVLLIFVGWSTIGVHAGVVRLLDVRPGDPMWTGAWFVEPALGTIVVGIIIVRAALRSAGGDIDGRGTAIEWGALTVSLVLNLAGVWPDDGFLKGVAAMVAHSLGPVGTMMTAVLISVVEEGVNKAKPFKDSPSMADPVVEVASESTQTESTHRLDRVDSHESTHEDQSESVILTHRLDVESPDVESGESTHEDPSESGASESTQRKPSKKVIQAKVEPVADRRQLVFNTYDAAVGAGGDHSHATISIKTGVPKATVTRYLRQRVDSGESTHSKINESTH